jgi:hypothetical protein
MVYASIALVFTIVSAEGIGPSRLLEARTDNI